MFKHDKIKISSRGKLIKNIGLWVYGAARLYISDISYVINCVDPKAKIERIIESAKKMP